MEVGAMPSIPPFPTADIDTADDDGMNDASDAALPTITAVEETRHIRQW